MTDTPAGSAVTLAHLVDSEVATRVVTRCGHFMERKSRGPACLSEPRLDGECSMCPPRPGNAAARIEQSGFEARVPDVPEPVVSEQDDWSPI